MLPLEPDVQTYILNDNYQNTELSEQEQLQAFWNLILEYDEDLNADCGIMDF